MEGSKSLVMCRFEGGRSGIAGVKGMGRPKLCLRRRELPQEAASTARLELCDRAGCQAGNILCILCPMEQGAALVLVWPN